MKKSYLAGVALSFSLAICSSVGYSAALQPTKDVSVQDSLIAKSFIQQNHSALQISPTEDDLKLMSAIRTQPTQSFFAAQHQKFSRFVQALFSTNS